ncbi:MAG: hydrogen peroxide-inducible genes activator [Bacteroidota bacterium]
MLSISRSQIQYVLALERTGSFSEAADYCFVTQSTLSTMIKKLEEQIEMRLFDRKSKPIALTTEGRALIDQFKIIHHEYENLTELIQETRDELYGTLKIGVIPTVAPFLLPLFLEKLISNHPDINFTVHEITTGEIVHLLQMRELDVGILSIPIANRGLVQKSLFKEDFLVYDANEISKKRKRYKVDEIDVSRLWLLEESHCMSNQIGKICQLRKNRKMNKNLVYRSGSILSLLQLVKSNQGLTLLPRLATLHKSIIDEQFLSTLENPSPAREVGIVTHPNFTKKRLLNILEKEILKAVKPVLKRNRELNVVDPF